MIAYIDNGMCDGRYYLSDAWTYQDYNDSGTTAWGGNGQCFYDKYKPWAYYPTRREIETPWLFDYTEPWKAPIHYPPAPVTVQPSKQVQNMHELKIRKQPPARSGFRRGQRREI